MLSVENRLFLLSRRTENILNDHLKEENYFMELFYLIANTSSYYSDRQSRVKNLNAESFFLFPRFS